VFTEAARVLKPGRKTGFEVLSERKGESWFFLELMKKDSSLDARRSHQ
jgi:hypothetical protein